jgi:carboxyl-terminal processing protease
MVILVDQLTASAGEIIALTLQEKGILVLGTQSFGKGTIQTVEELTDGSSIKYTIGKRYSPQGNNVNITGITPDIEIQRDAESYKEKRLDNQLEEAKKELMKLIF